MVGCFLGNHVAFFLEDVGGCFFIAFVEYITDGVVLFVVPIFLNVLN